MCAPISLVCGSQFDCLDVLETAVLPLSPISQTHTHTRRTEHARAHFMHNYLINKTTSQAVKKATNFSKQFVNHTRNCYDLDPYDTVLSVCFFSLLEFVSLLRFHHTVSSLFAHAAAKYRAMIIRNQFERRKKQTECARWLRHISTLSKFILFMF